MKKPVLTALIASAAWLVPGTAFAQDGSSTLQVALSANAPKSCNFSGPSLSVALTNERPEFRDTVTYTCNFADAIYTKITTTNGKLLHENGQDSVPYSLYFGDAPFTANSSWSGAHDYAAGGSGFGTLTRNTTPVAPGMPTKVNIGFWIAKPMQIAGNYSDQITISIIP